MFVYLNKLKDKANCARFLFTFLVSLLLLFRLKMCRNIIIIVPGQKIHCLSHSITKYQDQDSIVVEMQLQKI